VLLFIPEINNQLPKILGYQEKEIINFFCITESVVDFDDIIHMPEDELTTIERSRQSLMCDLQLGDFYITNILKQICDSIAN